MQSLSWYTNRLRLMSPAEVAWRARLSIASRLTRWLPRRTLEAADRNRIRMDPWEAPQATDTAHYVEAAERILRGEVDMFGRWVDLSRFTDPWHADPDSGLTAPVTDALGIDYRDASIVGNARNVWEINRHFQLVTLAQAWALTGDARFRDGCRTSLDSWLRAAPWPLGLNWISALEHGIRLINWYLMARLLRLSSTADDTPQPWLDSIHRHCAFIWAHQSKHSSANNHLIGEMAGLYVASSAWPCWRASARWRSESKRVLEREALAQVYPDGVLREQTVGYQFFVIQFLVIAGLVGEHADDPFSAAYWERVARMIAFLRSIADAAGNLPDFGDADQGMAYRLAPLAREHPLADLLELESVLFDISGNRTSQPMTTAQRGDSQARATAPWLRSGFPPPTRRFAAVPIRRRFPDGGYYILGRDRGTPAEVQVVFDAGPLGFLSLAAHGHADCLSFTLSLGGENVLIDPGTYCYHSSDLWRNYFRGTGAHNTVRIDAVNQSLMSGPFMWMHKAQSNVEGAELESTVQRIRASHDGYRRLPDPVEHFRELAFDTRADGFEVRDELECNAHHVVERFWHIAENCVGRQVDEHTVEIKGRRSTLRLRCGEDCKIQILRGSEAPRAGWFSPGFGVLRPTSTIIFTREIRSSECLVTSISWTLNTA